jgi:hypothetical protein
MTYKKQLHPWSIVRSLEGGQKISIGRFRRYNDASSHMHFLGKITPTLEHVIVFDPLDRLQSSCEEVGAGAAELLDDRQANLQSELELA